VFRSDVFRVFSAVAFFATACAAAAGAPVVKTGTQYPIDDAFYAAHLNWSFSGTPGRCYAATASALTDDLGFEIEHRDEAKREIITNRKVLWVNATRTTTGTTVSSGTSIDSRGTSSTVTTTTPTTTQQSFLAQQSVKYYLRIEGTDQTCTVRAYRWRAWDGEQELLQLQAEGIEWTEQHIFEPLRAEIARRLAEAPQPAT